jgi:hypothetical protein
MGNQSRYEIWKIELVEKGLGCRWAIWDDLRKLVVTSGQSESLSEGVLEARNSLTFLMSLDQKVKEQKA